MQHLLSYRLVIFPILTIVFAIAVIEDNSILFSKPEAAMYTYIAGTKAGKIGYGIPGSIKQPDISWQLLQPGDIVLGGNIDCAYGKYSHAGMYLGDNQVLEGFIDLGITVQSLDSYLYYNKLALLQVNVEPEIKKQAIEYAQQQKGELFYAIAFKPGEDLWNCTKIIWMAYAKQGIDLDEINDLWIIPDQFCRSRYITVLEERKT